MTIAELTDKIRAFRDARDWAQFHKPKDMAAAVAIEAAELQEHFLWKTHEASAEHLVKHGDEVAEEMADIAIYLVHSMMPSARLVQGHFSDLDLMLSLIHI